MHTMNQKLHFNLHNIIMTKLTAYVWWPDRLSETNHDNSAISFGRVWEVYTTNLILLWSANLEITRQTVKHIDYTLFHPIFSTVTSYKNGTLYKIITRKYP